MRKFDSGATRDDNMGKLDYEGFLSPIVLKRYAEYLNKHRVQSDGNLRDSDNWQGMFGEDHYKVCIKSAFRHFMDWWTEHREDSGSDTEIEEAICAVMFNAQAYLFKILKDKEPISITAEELSIELGISYTCGNPEFRIHVGCSKCLSKDCREREVKP